MKSFKLSLLFLAASFFFISFTFLLTGCSTPPPKPPVSDAAFEAEIGSGQLVLVKFGAQWCGPCRMVDKELDKLAEQGNLQAKIIEVDVDSNPNLARRYKVGGIPHMVLVRSNEVLDQQIGYLSADEIEEWIQDHLTETDFAGGT